MEQMNMQENARLVLGLRAAGWDEKKINDFLLYIETGEEQYKPKPDAKNEKQILKKRLLYCLFFFMRYYRITK